VEKTGRFAKCFVIVVVIATWSRWSTYTGRYRYNSKML